jgi:hypothetical protein
MFPARAAPVRKRPQTQKPALGFHPEFVNIFETQRAGDDLSPHEAGAACIQKKE